MNELINSIPSIADGFTNLVKQKLGTLDEETIKVSIERYKQCESCPLRVNNTCSTNRQGAVVKDFFYKPSGLVRKAGDLHYGCGCNITAKIVSPTAQCPLNFW